MKTTRILWLISPASLRSFELETLVSLGYEIFIPKLFQDYLCDSTPVDNFHDKYLSLPSDVLKKLNETDFFTQSWSNELIETINTYFDIVFCSFLPYLVMQCINHFKGKIFLRVFGLTNGTYTELLDDLCPGLIYKIEEQKSRIWFAEAYPDIKNQETSILKQIGVTLPFGLQNKDNERENTWQGSINKVLIFNASDPHNKLDKVLRGLPNKLVSLNAALAGDINIIIEQGRETFPKLLQHYKVLFYIGRGNHLDQYIIEGMIIGIPIIYIKDGFLGRIMGDDHPGICKDFKEARKKIKRILNGDSNFIDEIKRNQIKLKAYLLNEDHKANWKAHFLAQINRVSLAFDSKKNVFKIAVFLAHPYLGGTLNGAKNIAKMLKDGSMQNGDKVEVIFSYRKGYDDIKEHFGDLIEKGITIRETEWRVFSKQSITILFDLNKNLLDQSTYSLPQDGCDNFMNCDFWLIISDRLVKPIAPIKPYGIIIYDYIQRYVPEILGNNRLWKIFENTWLSAARNAKFVLSSTPKTCSDITTYAGVNENKVVLMPTDFKPYQLSPVVNNDSDYFIWPTNLANHKNHVTAIKALYFYYRKYNGKLKVLITGEGSHALTRKVGEYKIDKVYLKKIYDCLQESRGVKQNMIATGNLPTQEYVNFLANAKFLWHPVIIDNGTFTVLEAAYYNIPSLSSDYPQMKYLNERFKLNLTFFNAKDPEEMAQKLKEMEESYLLKQQTINKEYLNQFSCEKIARDFWQLLRPKLC